MGIGAFNPPFVVLGSCKSIKSHTILLTLGFNAIYRHPSGKVRMLGFYWKCQDRQIPLLLGSLRRGRSSRRYSQPVDPAKGGERERERGGGVTSKERTYDTGKIGKKKKVR